MRLLVVASLLALVVGCDSGSEAPSEDVEVDVDSEVVEDVDTGADDDTDAVVVTATGLEGYCERYKECGGTYYATADDCVDATVDYWGDCPEVSAALDAFGDCMMTIDCDDYNPDSYNPANTDCSQEWSDVRDNAC